MWAPIYTIFKCQALRSWNFRSLLPFTYKVCTYCYYISIQDLLYIFSLNSFAVVSVKIWITTCLTSGEQNVKKKPTLFCKVTTAASSCTTATVAIAGDEAQLYIIWLMTTSGANVYI